ncbi:MAG: hypothetical protein GF341_12045 [candidate division Zixibacteria bacterium]|nr:hypothetical protein [candidate division Zixibacteria bacterium]
MEKPQRLQWPSGPTEREYLYIPRCKGLYAITENQDDTTNAPEGDDSAAAETNKGTIKSFDTNRKFGFITQEDGKEVFLHQDAVLDGARVTAGDHVSYEVTEGPKGLRAVSVRKL